MFDQAQRSLWLEDQLWPKLRDAFPMLKRLPSEVLITVGYPSSGARGRSEKIRPAEINQNWQGNTNERAFVSVHPIYFTSPSNVAKAILYQGSKVTHSTRWGPKEVGLIKNDDGTIDASADTQAKIDAIIADVGEPPSGFGVAFPVRDVQRTRLRKYVCSTKLCSDGTTKHSPIRAASDTLTVECSTCKNAYVAE